MTERTEWSKDFRKRSKVQYDGKGEVISNPQWWAMRKLLFKVCNHGKLVIFHHNKRAEHGVIRKSFPPGFWVILNEG